MGSGGGGGRGGMSVDRKGKLNRIDRLMNRGLEGGGGGGYVEQYISGQVRIRG